ncbi:MAG: hypothetical protein ABL983_00155 [Nitrospira sp.]
MPRTPTRTLTRTTAIKKLLDIRLESWDADDTQKMIREGRQGLCEMSNLELAGLWQDWFEQPVSVTGKEPLAHRRIEHSVLEALITALTHITASVSMRGPAGTTGYLIAPDRIKQAHGALALLKTHPLKPGHTRAN